MKRTIAFILTLVMAILCCAAVQAETEKVMVNGNDIEIDLVRVDLLDYGSPSLNLVMRGVNNTDRKLYIRFADPVIDGVELYGYSQGLEPHEEADLGCLIFSDEGDTKSYDVIRNGKKLTLEVKISDSDTGDKILTETLTIDLPRKEKEEEKKTVNIPIYDTSKDSAGGPSSGGSSSSGSYHDVAPGKTITFGHYDQDGNVSNGVEPIDWLVLDVSGSKAFVVCNCGLFNAKYTEHSKQQVWENCDLRATLNSSFLYEAFSQAERDAIQLTYVDNSAAQGDPSAVSYRGYGNDTYDYLYLLSYAELVRYLPTQNDRVVQICKKFRDKGLGSPEYVLGMRTCNYWLRHPVFKNNAGGVTWSGTVESAYMNFPSCMVRPCCWVDVSMLGY